MHPMSVVNSSITLTRFSVVSLAKLSPVLAGLRGRLKGHCEEWTGLIFERFANEQSHLKQSIHEGEAIISYNIQNPRVKRTNHAWDEAR